MTFEAENTKHFLEVYEYLLENRIIADKKEFCDKIGISTTEFGKVQAGEIFITQDNIYNLVHHYYVNIYYIFRGTGKMFYVNTFTIDMKLKSPPKKDKMKSNFTSLEMRKEILILF